MKGCASHESQASFLWQSQTEWRLTLITCTKLAQPACLHRVLLVDRWLLSFGLSISWWTLPWQVFRRTRSRYFWPMPVRDSLRVSHKSQNDQNGCWYNCESLWIEWDWSEQSEFPMKFHDLTFQDVCSLGKIMASWVSVLRVFSSIWWGSWFWFDVCLVVLDFVLMLEMVPDSTKALTLFRLFRFAKFKHVPWSEQQILTYFLFEIELDLTWVYNQDLS